jgi:hypothetical protein
MCVDCVLPSSRIAQVDPDDEPPSRGGSVIVLGMFLTSSHPATILFNSGASHSFKSSCFVAKHNLPIATMRHTMIVSSLGSEMRTKHICPAVSINIRGLTFRRTSSF